MPDPRIELRSVIKRFGGNTAVARLDLTINASEFVVLLGPSGCGKTTTLRMIAGLEEPSEGQIFIDGNDVTKLRAGQRDIAFVFQMFALYPHFTTEQNIAFPLRAAGLPTAEVRKRVAQVTARLGLEPLLKRRPRQLAGGDQQRVSLARAMVRKPKAFLMDEPLGTLDADQREKTRLELRALHNELAAHDGATTVFVTHDQLEAMSLADRIAVMNGGKLLQFDTPRQVYDHPADLFVAHFIGSPGMNFLTATRTETGYQIEGTTVNLPTRYAKNDKPSLTLGIRPEYIRLASAIDATAIPVMVEHTQRLGSYNLINLTLGTTTIKARVPADVRLSEGTPTHVTFAPAGLRWFDSVTGQALVLPPHEVPVAAL